MHTKAHKLSNSSAFRSFKLSNLRVRTTSLGTPFYRLGLTDLCNSWCLHGFEGWEVQKVELNGYGYFRISCRSTGEPASKPAEAAPSNLPVHLPLLASEDERIQKNLYCVFESMGLAEPTTHVFKRCIALSAWNQVSGFRFRLSTRTLGVGTCVFLSPKH